MKKLMMLIVLLVVGVVGFGFYRGWFGVSSGNSANKSNVTLTLDQGKLQEDRKVVTETVQRQVEDKQVAEGTMVRFKDGKLTIADKEGKDQAHTLAADVKVTCDAKTCEIARLKAGMKVRLTMSGDTTPVVARVDALENNRTFE